MRSSVPPATAPAAARVRLGAAAQRLRIRDAAVRVFSTRGIAETAVEDVIAAAQVSRQTFYRCFRSKADLLDAVHRGVTARLEALAEAIRGDDPHSENALARHVELLFDHAASSGPIVCELEREAMRPDSPYRAHREERLRFAEQFVASWVERHAGQKLGAPLAHAAMLALDQLWLEVAQTGGTDRAVRTRNLCAATELLRALLAVSGSARAGHAAPASAVARSPRPRTPRRPSKR